MRLRFVYLSLPISMVSIVKKEVKPMSEPLFRKKTLDKITSPEQLNDYIRVSNPGVWMILLAVVILLIGVCVWSIFGHLDTKMETVGVAQNGKVVCYVKEADYSKIHVGMPVIIHGTEYVATEISAAPNPLDDTEVLAAGNFSANEKVYSVTVNATLQDGIYQVILVTQRVSPISFVLN